MNTFDKLSIKQALTENFDIRKVKLPIKKTSQALQDNGVLLTIWDIDSKPIHGFTMIQVNEHGRWNFEVSGKALQGAYVQGITPSTLPIIVNRFNAEVYPNALKTDTLLASHVGTLDQKIDLMIDPEIIILLKAIRLPRPFEMKITQHGNIIISCETESHKFRLTIYDKSKEFKKSSKANNELRKHKVQLPECDLWRFELRITTLNGVRQYAGVKRADAPQSTDKAHLLKPEVWEVLMTSTNVLIDTLKMILSNVMTMPGIIDQMNDKEKMLYWCLEAADFDRKKAKAKLMKMTGLNGVQAEYYYRNHYSSLLTKIEAECKQLKPKGDTITEVLECLKS
jgi:hypothetical protein